MRANTSPHIQVKAAGGVRTLDALLDVMNARRDPGRRDGDGDDHRRLPGAQGRRRGGDGLVGPGTGAAASGGPAEGGY